MPSCKHIVLLLVGCFSITASAAPPGSGLLDDIVASAAKRPRLDSPHSPLDRLAASLFDDDAHAAHSPHDVQRMSEQLRDVLHGSPASGSIAAPKPSRSRAPSVRRSTPFVQASHADVLAFDQKGADLPLLTKPRPTPEELRPHVLLKLKQAHALDPHYTPKHLDDANRFIAKKIRRHLNDFARNRGPAWDSAARSSLDGKTIREIADKWTATRPRVPTPVPGGARDRHVIDEAQRATVEAEAKFGPLGKGNSAEHAEFWYHRAAARPLAPPATLKEHEYALSHIRRRLWDNRRTKAIEGVQRQRPSMAAFHKIENLRQLAHRHDSWRVAQGFKSIYGDHEMGSTSSSQRSAG